MKKGRVIVWYLIEAPRDQWRWADPLDMATWPKSVLITIWEGEPIDPLNYYCA